jgi:glutamate racemase
VVSLPAAGLVEFVEEEMYRASPAERARRARREVDRFRDERIDALVLGCTHFLHLEEEFRRSLEGEGIVLVDSREGVAHQVQRLLAVGRQNGNGGNGGPDALYLTGALPLEDRYGWFAAKFDLRLAGIL